MEALDLVVQLGNVGRARIGEGGRGRAGHTVSAHHVDVADLAVADAAFQFLAGIAVPAHQADADLEVVPGRFLAERQHPPRAGAVDRDRLLHEDVQPFLDGVGELHPAEGRRGGEDHHVAFAERVHRSAIAVEADEATGFGHLDLVAKLVLQAVEAIGQPGLKDVRHRGQAGRPARLQRVLGGAGATAAAADQGDLNRVRLAGVNLRQGDSRVRPDGGDLARGLDHVAARNAVGLFRGHGVILSTGVMGQEAVQYN